MTDDEFLIAVKSQFYPAPFPEDVSGVDDIPLLLVRQAWFGAKYGLAAAPWSATTLPTAQIGRLRSEIAICLDLSVFRNAGVIVIWYGEQTGWAEQASQLKADRHGVRNVIIQGMVFVDPKSGANQVDQSRWGPLRFGNWHGQFDKLSDFLNSLATMEAST
jgi:hypothetical protein